MSVKKSAKQNKNPPRRNHYSKPQSSSDMKAKSLPPMNRNLGLFAQRMKQQLGAFVAAGLVILAVGCASDNIESTTGQSIDDDATSNRVQVALSSDTAYKYTDVKVTTYHGTVQLSGFVDNSKQRDQAEAIAKKTKGVKEVKNDIVIK